VRQRIVLKIIPESDQIVFFVLFNVAHSAGNTSIISSCLVYLHKCQTISVKGS
jgi:hypothetical protein